MVVKKFNSITDPDIIAYYVPPFPWCLGVFSPSLNTSLCDTAAECFFILKMDTYLNEEIVFFLLLCINWNISVLKYD